jgi:TonB-dependent SusC/RagA subfamily outer membrane receptor
MNRALLLKKNLFMERCSRFHKIKGLLMLLGVLLGATAFSQTTVTGKVTSADSVLSDVTVAVKNGTAATKTNINGDFSIAAAVGDILVFTFVGFTTQEVKVTSNRVINISLVSQSRQLNDVVVVGYGTQRKGSITGAVSSIKAADLVRTPSSTVSSALVGKIQGVTARQATGRPGAGTTLQIRNLGTPLYVIDGVPQSEGQFNNIGMEDIENISVLKDGSAALYGFRASNGVVLVGHKEQPYCKQLLPVAESYALYFCFQCRRLCTGTGRSRTKRRLNTYYYTRNFGEMAAGQRKRF